MSDKLQDAIMKRPTMRAPTLWERHITQAEEQTELENLTPWERANRTGNILDLLPDLLKFNPLDAAKGMAAGLTVAAPRTIKAFHGTRAAFKKFATQKFGHPSQPGHKLIHAGEDPSVAQAVALEGRDITRRGQDFSGLNIIPITNRDKIGLLDASGQPALDYTDKMVEDIIKSLAKREIDKIKKIADRLNKTPAPYVQDNLYRASIGRYQPSSPYTIMDMFSPSTFSKEGIHAIRYGDTAGPALAFTPQTALETPWGVPLTRNPRFHSPLEAAILRRGQATRPKWLETITDFEQAMYGPRGAPDPDDLWTAWDSWLYSPEKWIAGSTGPPRR